MMLIELTAALLTTAGTTATIDTDKLTAPPPGDVAQPALLAEPGEGDRQGRRRGPRAKGEFGGQEMQGRQRGHHRHGKRAMAIEHFDADGDGTLNEGEIATMKDAIETKKAEMKEKKAEMKARLIGAFDANGDGELSADEKDTVRAWKDDQREIRRSIFLDRFDTDGDDEMSPEERDAAKEHFRAIRESHKANLKQSLDTDDDGELSRDERQAGKGAMKRLLRDRTLDLNFDGRVDAQDVASAQAMLGAGGTLPDFNRDFRSDELDLIELMNRVNND